jgi:hypothetical protein
MPEVPGSTSDIESMTVGISALQVLRRTVHPGSLQGYDK